MEKKENMMKEKMTAFKGQTVQDAEQEMIYSENPCKETENSEDNKVRKNRLVVLETCEDSYFQKVKKLESNNTKLGNERDNLFDRLEKLKEYYDLMKEGKVENTDD